jgi:hypothetical protein
MNKELKRPVMQAIVAFIFIVLIKIVSILTLRKIDIVYPAVDIILSIAVIFILLRFRNEFNSLLPRSSHNFPAAISIVSGVVLLLVIVTIYETFALYSNILPYGLYHIIFFFLVLIPVYSLWKILYDMQNIVMYAVRPFLRTDMEVRYRVCGQVLPSILRARWAAFSPLSIPTHATGTPRGIWTMDKSASIPPSLELTGTPMTGLLVRDAITPGSAADNPAMAIKTSASLFDTYSSNS